MSSTDRRVTIHEPQTPAAIIERLSEKFDATAGGFAMFRLADDVEYSSPVAIWLGRRLLSVGIWLHDHSREPRPELRLWINRMRWRLGLFRPCSGCRQDEYCGLDAGDCVGADWSW